MRGSLVEDAFGHHVWATLRLVDACLALSPEQLETAVPGTYGSILDTLRHSIGSDAWDLFVATGDRAASSTRTTWTSRSSGPRWSATAPHGHGSWRRTSIRMPSSTEVDENDGYTRTIAMGVQLAQALQHGTDHRSQIAPLSRRSACEPPPIDILDFGMQVGLVVEITPAS